MINKPTIADILRSLSHDLTTSIVPALSDDSLVSKAQMMAALMDAIAIRTENEPRWRAEQISEIVAVAEEAVPRLAPNHPVFRALSTIKHATPTDENYQNASELLSCLAEAALESDDETLNVKVRALLKQRLEAEISVIGENFQAIGRG